MACTHTWPWSFLMVLLICSGLRLFRDLMRPKLLELSVSGLRKTIVFQKELLEIKRFSLIRTWTIIVSHGITPYPCGPRTPWPNRAETAVRLFINVHGPLWPKHLLMKAMVERVTVRQAVKKVVWARNCQLTISGYSPLEIATGRRPPDLLDVENSTPEQLSADPSEER